ncbi:MAG: hypothetical protein ACKVWV_20150 [Planctomycetota bacterium]
MRVRRIVSWSLVAVAAAATFVVWQIGPRNVLGMLRYDQRREGTLRVGDVAPDIVLHRIDGSGAERLAASIGEKPLVLVFGSFT